MGCAPAERPRVPDQRYTDQGKSGPKDKPKGEADGQPVKIPAPTRVRSGDGVAKAGKGDGIPSAEPPGEVIPRGGSREKPISASARRPYRKPTQVVGH